MSFPPSIDKKKTCWKDFTRTLRSYNHSGVDLMARYPINLEKMNS